MSHTAPERTPTRVVIRAAVMAMMAVAVVITGWSLAGHSVMGSAVELGGIRVTGIDETATDADGVLPDGVTVFDDRYPGVVNIDPHVLEAVRTAASDAAADGIEFRVSSGWRSPAYQSQLLHEAILEYGSEQEAARWVAPVSTSAHVSGDAVDISAPDATAWLSDHGAGYGLCQIYANESWHFELRPEAIAHGCPALFPDAAHDPRMQR